MKPRHLARQGLVYVRQSTVQQVLNNRECSRPDSTPWTDRAVALGGPPERVEVIDDDQGKRGQTAEDRLGLQSLLSPHRPRRVGIILGLEMSRLARSNEDWHQLLELCAVFRDLAGRPGRRLRPGATSTTDCCSDLNSSMT